MKPAITLRSIAERADCSQNTVSLALRDSSRIAEATRIRVKQIADELGYAPNRAARHLRSNRSGLIGVHSWAIDDHVRARIVNDLLQGLTSREYQPVLGLSEQHVDRWYDSPWMDIFQTLQVEALVVITQRADEIPDWCERIPVILAGNYPNPSLPCDYVALDRAQAGAQAVEFLATRGRSRILVDAPEAAFGRGALDWMEANGLRSVPFPAGRPESLAESFEALGYTLAGQPDRPDAAVIYNSDLAAAFIAGLMAGGCRVPDDMAVIGYNATPLADYLAVPLTTVEQPIRELARCATSLVRSRLADPKKPWVHLDMKHTLVPRASA